MDEDYDDLIVILEPVPSSSSTTETTLHPSCPASLPSQSSTSKVPEDLSESGAKTDVVSVHEFKKLFEYNENKLESGSCVPGSTNDISEGGKRPQRVAAVQSNRNTDFLLQCLSF